MKSTAYLLPALLALSLTGCHVLHPWPDAQAFASLRVTFKS